MKQELVDIYYIIESAVDNAFLKQNLNLNLYEYLKQNKYTKEDIDDLLESPCVNTLSSTSNELNEYIEGGSDNFHKQLREAYGYISKPAARKIKIYFDNIIADIIKYKESKGKRVRRKK